MTQETQTTDEQKQMDRAEREAAMAELRKSIRRSEYSYKSIAGYAGVSQGWVGLVMRGSYPSYRAFLLPKNIRVALAAHGFKVNEILWTY